MLPSVPSSIPVTGMPVIVKQKSPSVRKRDKLRMSLFNAKQREKQFLEEKKFLETKIRSLHEESQCKSKTIAKLEVEISVIKSNSKKSKPKLSMMKISSQSISPTTKPKPLLSFSKVSYHEIPPKPESNSKITYHPNVIEACKMIYGKLPEQLTAGEAQHFQAYREWKIGNGQPIETDIAYKPID